MYIMSPSDSDRIEALTETVGDMCVLVKVSLAESKADRKRVDRLERRVEGPDDEPEKGMVIKMDRVTEAQKTQKWFVRLLAALALAQGLKYLIG